MPSNHEYNVLRIFDGKDWRGGSRVVTETWYSKQLAALMPVVDTEAVKGDLLAHGLIELVGENKSVKLTPEGIKYLDTIYYRDLAYDIVDECLMKVQHHDDGIDTSYRNRRVQNLAEEILADNLLVRYLSSGVKALSMVRLLDEGHKVIDAGGIRRYLKAKNGVDEQDTEAVFKYIVKHAENDRLSIKMDDTARSLNMDISELRGTLDHLEQSGKIEQLKFMSDLLRGITLLKGNSSRTGDSFTIATPVTINHNYHGNVIGSVLGDANNSPINQQFSNVSNENVNQESEEVKRLTKMQTDDIPKNAWYRKGGYLVALACLLVALGSFLYMLLSKK